MDSPMTPQRAFHELRQFIIHVLEPARVKLAVTHDKWLTPGGKALPKGGACDVVMFGRNKNNTSTPEKKKNPMGDNEVRYFDIATAFKVGFLCPKCAFRGGIISEVCSSGEGHVRSVSFVIT